MSAASGSFSTGGPPAPGYRDFNINGSIFRLDSRYEIIKPIGHGAYGLVVYPASPLPSFRPSSAFFALQSGLIMHRALSSWCY